MVLLTMTPSMVEWLTKIHGERQEESAGDESQNRDGGEIDVAADEAPAKSDGPDLASPAVGQPISHGQVLELWQTLKKRDDADALSRPATLETLLVGATVYVPPPVPKAEPTSEYKALMARLRRDEEARAYARMVSPPDPFLTTKASAAASSFAHVNRPHNARDLGDDDDAVTLADVNRQVMVILNFVLTMGGVAYTLWVLARWWPTPSRLFLAMGGSVLVGVAEYGLYAGYMWHLSEAKKKDKKEEKIEVKEVVRTWVVGADADADTDAAGKTDSKAQLVGVSPKEVDPGLDDSGMRRRKKETPIA